jgi:hypothetical protein
MDSFDRNLAENIRVSRESDYEYAKWYATLPDQRKARFLAEGFQFAYGKVRYDERKANPFVTDADVTMKFIEHTQKADYPPETFAFIREQMALRSEAEWIARFKTMKKILGWTYDEMARYIGAASGAALRASVNRKLPAFAKLAVCVFEQMNKK